MAMLVGPAFRSAFKKDFPAVSDDQIRSMYEGMTRTARQTLLELYRRLTRANLFDDVAADFLRIAQTCDLTMVWGQDDALIAPAEAERLGGRVIRLEGCGHWVPLERPEALATVIRARSNESS